MFRLTFAVSWMALVAGCGQKGPLYHPPTPEPEPKPDEESEDEQTSVTPPAPGSRLA